MIREVMAVGGLFTDGTISTVAGDGVSGNGGDGGQPTAALLLSPQGVAVDGSGNLFIADSGNNVIRKVTPGTDHVLTDGTITTFVGGDGGLVYANDNGLAATDATLDHPDGIVVDSHGDIFIADEYFNVVREVTPAAGPNLESNITTIAGNGNRRL